MAKPAALQVMENIGSCKWIWVWASTCIQLHTACKYATTMLRPPTLHLSNIANVCLEMAWGPHVIVFVFTFFAQLRKNDEQLRVKKGRKHRHEMAFQLISICLRALFVYVYVKFLQLSICHILHGGLFRKICNAIDQAVATKTVKKSYGLGIHNTWQHVVCLADFWNKLFHMRIRVAALWGIMGNFCQRLPSKILYFSYFCREKNTRNPKESRLKGCRPLQAVASVQEDLVYED